MGPALTCLRPEQAAASREDLASRYRSATSVRHDDRTAQRSHKLAAIGPTHSRRGAPWWRALESPPRRLRTAAETGRRAWLATILTLGRPEMSGSAFTLLPQASGTDSGGRC